MTLKTTESKRSVYMPVLLVLAVALTVRVVYLFQYSQLPDWEILTVDNWYHYNWANSLADGNILGDTTYFRAPLYAWCLGLAHALFGASLWVGRLFGMAVGLGSVLMTYVLGRKLLDHKTGLTAALIHAVYPIAIYFESELLLDPLFTLLVQVTIYRFVVWLETKKRSDLFLCGLVCGLAAITRPTILVAVPLMIALIVFRRGLPDHWRQLGALILGLTITVGPVTIRNMVVAGDPVLISSQAGINLFIGNNDGADGFSAAMPEPFGNNWNLRQVTHIAETDRGRRLRPGEVSSYWTERAARWIIHNPGDFARLFFTKLGSQFSDRKVSNNRSLDEFFSRPFILKYNPISFGAIAGLALLGCLSVWRIKTAKSFTLLFLLLYVLATSMFFFNSRFRLPLLPLYFVLASAGIWFVIGLLRTQRMRSAGYIVLAGFVSLAAFLSENLFQPIVTPNHLMSKGLYYYSHQDYRTAQEFFEKALSLYPTNSEINLNLGACLFKQGSVDSARYYFERELVFHPERPKVYNNLASLDLLAHHYESAQRWIRKALRIAPYDITANTIWLRILASDSALSAESLMVEIEKSLVSTDFDLTIHNEGATLLAERGDLAAARSLLARVLDASAPPIETDDFAFGPDFPHGHDGIAQEKAKAHYQLGYINGLQGHIEESIGHSTAAIGLDSTLAEAYVNLISGYVSAGQRWMADSVMDDAAERFPNHPAIKLLRESQQQ
ncbi:MAG: hypothetical protein DRP45_00300 [Candidatus Zixiibacteriota bacterium]|nr:MAG: hypothetical protein DRP45_00300 [candidate division Zixibacteria bacterium]